MFASGLYSNNNNNITKAKHQNAKTKNLIALDVGMFLLPRSILFWTSPIVSLCCHGYFRPGEIFKTLVSGWCLPANRTCHQDAVACRYQHLGLNLHLQHNCIRIFPNNKRNFRNKNTHTQICVTWYVKPPQMMMMGKRNSYLVKTNLKSWNNILKGN